VALVAAVLAEAGENR